MFLVYLSGVRPSVPAIVPSAPVTPASAPAVPANTASKQPAAPPKRVSPVFEFYSKLPEGGQPVTDIAPTTEPPPAAAASAPTGSTSLPSEAQSSHASSTTNTAPVAATAPVDTTTPPAPTTDKASAVQPSHKASEEALDPIQQLLAQKEKEKQQKSVATTKSTVSTKAAGVRYLQAGVFRNRIEAEKLRSKISRLGVNTSVQTINSANGDILQKVLAGPFATAGDVDKAHALLSGSGINTIPVR